MPADPQIYNSERLARYYAGTRPPIHAAICAKLWHVLPVSFKARAAWDIGCGAGVSTAELVPYAEQVVGIDPYLPMLMQARQRVPAASFVQATATALPANAASIDLITAAGSLNYTDIQLSLAEVARVLTPAGYLALYDFATGRVFPPDASTESHFLSFEHRFHWPPGYAMALDSLPYAAHGLSLLHFETFDFTLTMSADDYMEYLLGETNIEAAIAAGLSEVTARETCLQLFAPLFASGPRTIGFACVLAVATKSAAHVRAGNDA